MNVLSKQLTIKLNALWQPISIITVGEAVTFLCPNGPKDTPGLVIDFESVKDETTGEYVLTYTQEFTWEEWIKLEVRPNDLYINTSRGKIRVPLVVTCTRFAKLPKRNTRWSTGNVHRRDGYICAYTNERLTHSTATVDHILPRSRGGRDTWENTVSCHRRINTLKGDKTPTEAGLTLLRRPKAPPAMPIVIRKEDAPLPIQTPFLT